MKFLSFFLEYDIFSVRCVTVILNIFNIFSVSVRCYCDIEYNIFSVTVRCVTVILKHICDGCARRLSARDERGGDRLK